MARASLLPGLKSKKQASIDLRKQNPMQRVKTWHMVNIFTSGKTFSLESKLSPPILLNRFRETMADDNLGTELLNTYNFKGKFVGKVQGNKVAVRHISAIQNSLQPVLRIEVFPGEKSGSKIRARYTTNRFVQFFLMVWMAMACGASLTMAFQHAHSNSMIVAGLFPIYGIFLIYTMRLMARRDESKLEGFMHGLIADAEAEARGERIKISDPHPGKMY